ncbi:MAG: MSEP-CTERM sorting domain-containing protein [Deltaproteobacteria bacterium]|nr:MAG: MSEP-CTERM sorting domain-containing protein [Deltaproteobacteria bacterium]
MSEPLLDQALFTELFDWQPQAFVWLRPLWDEAGGQINDFEYIFSNEVGLDYLKLQRAQMGSLRLSTTPSLTDELRQKVLGELVAAYTSGDTVSVDMYNPVIDRYARVYRIRFRGGVLTTIQDKTTEQRAIRELRERSRQLEQSNADLEEFAYAASHDLQEPLRKITTFSDRLAHELGGQLSAGQQGRKAAYVRRVQRLLQAQPLPGPERFSLVNTYTTPVPLGTDWQQALQDFANAGGCYLTGAVRRTLTAAQLHPAATYPRLVVVTDSLQTTVLPADFADLQAAYPESDAFYVLRPDGQLEPHSLRQAASQPLRTALVPDSPSPAPTAVRAWPTAAHAQAYLPDNDEAAIVLPHPAAPLAVPAGAPTRWLTGLLLHGFDQWQSLHPEAAERGHIPFIKASFQAHILTPLTAYLVLENEAQKAALRRKQNEILAANLNLDAQEAEPPHPGRDATAVPLNEGEWPLLVLGLAFGARQLRRRLVVV